MAIALAGAGGGRLASPRGGLAGVSSGHRPGAFALPVSSDMRFAFALLLGGAAAGFLAFGSPQVAAIATVALVFRLAGFLQRNRDRLAAAFDLAASAALEFA